MLIFYAGDFEAAVWKAVRSLMPTVQLYGCLFHWNQAVFRKIQELGIAKSYMERRSTHNFCRKLMALPFLPATWIVPVFNQLKELDVSTELQELMTYISGQWIQSQIFPVTSWSVFQWPFRTNNDVEGWHHKLNQQANGAALNMYDLITRLHEEAKDVELLCHFLEEGQITRVQRKKFVHLHERIQELWDQFQAGAFGAQQLLKSCSKLNGPSIQ